MAIRVETGLTDSKATLFVDGHSSRHNGSLKEFLVTNNVDVVLWPPPSRHILQPMDCGVNGAFKQIYTHSKKTFMKLALPERRRMLLSDAREALFKAATPRKIKESFEKAGIYPWNIDLKLASDMVFRTIPPELAQRPYKRRRTSVSKNGGLLTSHDAISEQLEFEIDSQRENIQEAQPTGDKTAWLVQTSLFSDNFK
jgi:hypothetical protein